MAGCKSCSSCSPERAVNPTKKAEKLEKGERSDNPRYPHIFVGKQAVYSDSIVQLLVTVLSDNCDDACDCFELQPNRVLRNQNNKFISEQVFEVSKIPGENCWKLHALL
jgi:hypothetical protein